MPVDQIVDVITMRNGFVPAARAVHMLCLVRRAGMTGRAPGRVLVVHREAMVVHVIPVHVMQVTIVQEVHMLLVAHAGVPAIIGVAMIVIAVWCAGHSMCLLEHEP